LDKEYILISRRYQLHPASATTQCSNDNMDAQAEKKKDELHKRKVPPQRFIPCRSEPNTTITTPKIHLL
jgi:hypothetical protein